MSTEETAVDTMSEVATALTESAMKRRTYTKAEAQKVALEYAHSLMHKCGRPGCKRWFFNDLRRKYCSKKCVEFGKKQAKRAWWSKYGKTWREYRRVTGQ